MVLRFLFGLPLLFFSAIVSTYSYTYLKGFKYHKRFTLFCLGFTLSVIIFVMSNHVIPLLISWLVMGFFMARLIGVNSDWGEAREASKFAQKFFLAGSALLSIGVLLLSYQSKQYTLSGIINNLDTIPYYIFYYSCTLYYRSCNYTICHISFSSMVAFCNDCANTSICINARRFCKWSRYVTHITLHSINASNTLILIFIIGGLTAIIAQFTKLLQVNVKQKLACSTIAQMGFMIMQCGLGFFNAAVVHLLLHGFYKAYLFLSSGEEIAQSAPSKPIKIKIKPLQAFIVLIFGIAGAILFSLLTGKTSLTDSSIFLTLIVAITVGQATYNIVKQKSLSTVQKIIVPILLFVVGISTYALLYNGVTILMMEMPMIEVPQSLSVLQIVFGVIFLIGFFIMKLGVYRKVPWIYVKLLNLSQPHKKTILTYKNLTK